MGKENMEILSRKYFLKEELEKIDEQEEESKREFGLE